MLGTAGRMEKNVNCMHAGTKEMKDFATKTCWSASGGCVSCASNATPANAFSLPRAPKAIKNPRLLYLKHVFCDNKKNLGFAGLLVSPVVL